MGDAEMRDGAPLTSVLDKDTADVTDSDFNLRAEAVVDAAAEAAREARLAEEAQLEDVMLPPPDDDVVRRYNVDDIADRARFIPVRLTLKERKTLRLVSAALDVSEYTDKACGHAPVCVCVFASVRLCACVHRAVRLTAVPLAYRSTCSPTARGPSAFTSSCSTCAPSSAACMSPRTTAEARSS